VRLPRAFSSGCAGRRGPFRAATLGLAGIATALGTLAWGQTPVPPSPFETRPAPTSLDVAASIKSLGQPPLWKPYTGAFYGRDRSSPGGPSLGGGMVGIYRDLLPSIIGAGLSGEGWVGSSGRGLEGGARALADLRGIALKVGFEFDVRQQSTSFILSANVPLRRGGILGRGSLVRVDWLPGRGNSWNFGILIPLEPHMGRTRPRDTEVDMPKPPPARLAAPAPRDRRIDEAMAQVRESARWIQVLTHVFWDDHRWDRVKSLERTRREVRQFKQLVARRDPLRPNGHTLEAEVEVLHGQLARAFGLAAGAAPPHAAARGEPIAARAKEAMLDEVVFPYNRLFGQYKRNDSLLALGANARTRFAAWVRDDAGAPASRAAAVLAVFDAYLDALEGNRAAWLERLEGESRGVFLPFQLVLRPAQHDSQAEIDAIIERAVEARFTTGNSAVYTSGQQFQHEIARMIRETEDYHVLWVHDLCGVAENGEDPDAVSFGLAVHGYIAALTERALAFDRSGKLPVFMILVDLPYYESKKGRLVADLLEDPLRHRVSFPRGFDEMQRRVERAQGELRRAVAGSRRLQEAAARGGAGWLRRVIKVHVSVTNPADFSYRTSRIVGYLPIAPDNAIRDHRKIAFRDVTELDPAKGEALFTGVSVGEQYATPTWEDRSLLATGPAVLRAKEAARRYLLANGFREDEIPPPLRPLPTPADYDEKVRALEAGGATARALQVHNQRGFARKDASLVNAILYTLSPPGSLIIVPNPIWTSMGWASQLVGAALRGCHVYVIAPSRKNAPSAGFLQLSRSREVLSRFLEIERLLAPEIESAGGRLKTGLYDRRADVEDVAGRLRDVAAGYREYPFLRDDFPLPDSLYDLLDRAPQLVAESGTAPSLLPDSVRQEPKLHRKTQFIGSREALLALAEQPATQELLRAQLTGQVEADSEGLAIPGRKPLALINPLIEAHRSLPADVRERSLYYLTVGSLNKDARGMVLDGEVLYVLSSEWSLWAYTDFFFLLGSTTWLTSQQEFDALLPPYNQLERRLGRWFRKAI